MKNSEMRYDQLCVHAFKGATAHEQRAVFKLCYKSPSSKVGECFLVRATIDMIPCGI